MEPEGPKRDAVALATQILNDAGVKYSAFFFEINGHAAIYSSHRVSGVEIAYAKETYATLSSACQEQWNPLETKKALERKGGESER